MHRTSCKVKSKNKLLVQQQQRAVSHLSERDERTQTFRGDYTGVAIEFQFG